MTVGGQRSDPVRIGVDQRGEPYGSSGGRRFDVDSLKRREARLQLGKNFQDHPIRVELRVVLGHLTLPKRVIQRFVDGLPAGNL